MSHICKESALTDQGGAAGFEIRRYKSHINTHSLGQTLRQYVTGVFQQMRGAHREVIA